MKNTLRHMAWGTLLVMAAAGCTGQGAQDGADGGATVAVRTVAVDRASFPVRLAQTGTLKGDRQTVLVAKVQSVVTGVSVTVGERVAAGQRLIDLDRGGVQSQFTQTEAVFRDAQSQLDKLEPLYTTGAVSERELELARTSRDVARANFEAARQAVEIESPIAGVVTDLHVRGGDEVSPGRPLVEVADVKALRLTLEVPAGDRSQLKVGQPVRVCAPFDSASCMDGKVFSIADAADRDTRSFEVECRFGQPVPGLAPGTFVSAEILIRTLEDALTIPRDAVIYRGGGAFAYAVDADSVLLVALSVLATAGEQVAVAGPLLPGQRVVVAGQRNLTPGTRVREAAS
jgi:membrane fusion protein (multidrug efflux system)